MNCAELDYKIGDIKNVLIGVPGQVKWLGQANEIYAQK